MSNITVGSELHNKYFQAPYYKIIKETPKRFTLDNGVVIDKETLTEVKGEYPRSYALVTDEKRAEHEKNRKYKKVYDFFDKNKWDKEKMLEIYDRIEDMLG